MSGEPLLTQNFGHYLILSFAGWSVNKAVDAWVATHPAAQQNQLPVPVKP